MTKAEISRFRSSRQWRDRVRPRHLFDNPICVICDGNGALNEATEVDHIVPLESGGEPLDPSNLQSLCKRCHVIKTSEENRQRNLKRSNNTFINKL